MKDNISEINLIWQELVKPDPTWEIVTDGSYYEPVAAYAWILYDGPTIVYTGKGMAPGNPPSAF